MAQPAAHERAVLPLDARELSPLGPAFHEPLDAALRDLSLQLPPHVRAALEAQARLLVAWSSSINLTAHRTPERIALEHVADSLAALWLLREPLDLLDLGSGAGYPGLPLAVAGPVRRALLVDSIGKKQRFLAAASRAAVAEFDPHFPRPSIGAVAERAEDMAQAPEHREAWTVVTARAVAATSELVELAFPLLARGGRLIAWKRDDGTGALARELASARRSIALCGGGDPEVHTVPIGGLEDHRLVVIAKRRPTPGRLPRPAGERRRPLLP